MQISFWSPCHGRGSTANCIAAALSFALKYNATGLITNTQYIKSTLDDAFFSEKQRKTLKTEDYGIDAIDRLILGKTLLTRGDFFNYSNSIIDDRLDLLCGSHRISEKSYKESIGSTIIRILENAKNCYDVTFIDVNSGSNDQITQRVLNNSNLIVVSLDQSEKTIADFFEKDYPQFKDKELIIILSRYDVNSKCSKKYVKSMFKYEGTIFSIPYSTDFLDAINEHRVRNYFYSNNKLVRREKNSSFFYEVNMITEKIYTLLNNPTIEKKPIGAEDILSKVRNALSKAI